MKLRVSLQRRFGFARIICKVLPPILAHQIQEYLINSDEGVKYARDFKKKSITGGFLRGNTRDVVAFKFSIHGYYDWRNIALTKKILQYNSGNVIEVGANIGTETISFSRICKQKVYAFEPEPANFKALCQLKKENSIDNLHLENVIISNFNGKANFSFPEKNNSGTGHFVESDTINTGEYDVVTLDDNLNSIESCAVILIDVEGFELEVIHGAHSIIQKFKPYIIIEVNPNYLKKRGGISVLILYEELFHLGYTCYSIDKFRITKIKLDCYKVNSNKNWICIPKEANENKKILSNSIFLNSINPLINYKIF